MRDLLRYVVTNGTGQARPMSPAMTWAARPARPRCPARMAAISRMRCAPPSAAVFPVHNPRYVVFVLLDQPHGTKETGGFALAGYTAAPLAGRIIQRIAPLLGVPNTRRRPPSWPAGDPNDATFANRHWADGEKDAMVA